MQGSSTKRIITLVICFCAAPLQAAPYYGATLYFAALAKEPPELRGGQIMLNYDPDQFHWREFNLYFDGGYTHYWNKRHCYNHVINIYSIAPVIRYTFKQHPNYLHPYLEMSIGLAYMDQTRMNTRNLGIHFAFQDRMGFGTFLGPSQEFVTGMYAIHYSNAHLSTHNSGISVPIEIYIGYRFG